MKQQTKTKQKKEKKTRRKLVKTHNNTLVYFVSCLFFFFCVVVVVVVVGVAHTALLLYAWCVLAFAFVRWTLLLCQPTGRTVWAKKQYDIQLQFCCKNYSLSLLNSNTWGS